MNTIATIVQTTIRGDGVNLAVDVGGRAEDPPVLFLHGGGQTRASWGAAVGRAASAGFRAMALDLRGHGDSEWSPNGAYDIDRFAADLREIIGSLREPPMLVGASLGGIASLLVAGESSELVARGIVLVDIAPRIERKGVDRIRDFMGARPEGFSSIDEAADAVAAYLPHRRRPADPSGLLKNLRQGKDGRLRWHWDPRFVMHKFEESDMETQSRRLREAAVRLTIPVLLVRGALSEVVSEESARGFQTLVPHAEYVSIGGADHMVAGDRNDVFNEAVIDFLVRHRPR